MKTRSMKQVPWYKSLNTTLLFWFMLISILPLTIIMYVSNQTTIDTIKQNTYKNLQDTLNLEKQFLINWFYYRTVDISNWSKMEKNVDFLRLLQDEYNKSGKTLSEFIQSQKYSRITNIMEDDILTLLVRYDYIKGIYLIGEDGSILYTTSANDDLGTNLLTGKYSKTRFATTVKKTLDDGFLHFSDLERYKPSDDEVVGFISSPLINKVGKRIGIFAVELRLNRIYNLFDSKKLEQQFDNYLVGSDGYLRSSYKSPDDILKLKIDTKQFKLWRKEYVHGVPGHRSIKNYKKQIILYKNPFGEYVYGIHKDVKILGVEWALISEVKTSKVYEVTNKIVKEAFLLFIGIGIIIIIISLLLSRHIVKPLGELSKAAVDFARGNRGVEVRVESNDEIGQLGVVFQKMIEDIKRDEAKLKEANRVAQESVKAKSEFLASMSHEIRTPMNGVIGMLELLLKTKLNESQRHQAYLAQSSAKALLALINDILDFSKIEAGKMEIEHIDFDIRKDLGDFAEAIAFHAQEKGVDIVLDLVGVEQNMINSDPGRIRQILNNLVGNAVKFTHEGYILISAKLIPLNDKEAKFVVDVKDTGIGIPRDKIKTLFDSFTQVDASTTRKYGGTGLGLAIVKKLCNLMGGDVHVTSIEGEGSVFRVEIQVGLTEKSSLVLPPISLKDKKILLINPKEIDAKVMKRQLTLWGIQVVISDNLKDGITKLDSSFDLCFVDFQLIAKNVEAFGKKFKSSPKLEGIKLIAMTSIVNRGDTETFIRSGYDGYFPKPATTSDLFNALNVLSDDFAGLKNSLEHSTENNTLKIKWPQDVRILLVDDNVTNQLVANGILDSLGLSAEIANNGKDAIEMIQKASNENKPYSLVFMDCQMPIMDGYKATGLIRDGKAGEENKGVVIIAMTANAMQGDKEKCIVTGMDDYIAKPIDTKLLKEKLIHYLLNDEVIYEDAPTQEETSSKKAHEQADTEIDTDVWDKAEALSRLAGSEEILQKVIEMYIPETKQTIEKLQKALEEQNRDEVRLHAHTIKGSSANISAKQLQAVAKELEFGAKGDMSFEQMNTLFEQLKEDAKKVMDVLL